MLMQHTGELGREVRAAAPLSPCVRMLQTHACEGTSAICT